MYERIAYLKRQCSDAVLIRLFFSNVTRKNALTITTKESQVQQSNVARTNCAVDIKNTGWPKKTAHQTHGHNSVKS